jgi:hypothetical protein
MTESVSALLRDAASEAEDGKAARVRAGVGRVWEATKAFKAAPRSATAAVAAELMRRATVVKDVCEELETLGKDGEGEGEDSKPPVGTDEDDLRFCDEDFDEDEMQRAKALSTYSRACMALLKAFILPTVQAKKKTKLARLEPIVDACAAFQSAVEEVGAGAYPPQELDELTRWVKAALEAAISMHACVRGAGIGSETVDDALDAFRSATQTALEALKEE